MIPIIKITDIDFLERLGEDFIVVSEPLTEEEEMYFREWLKKEKANITDEQREKIREMEEWCRENRYPTVRS